MKTTIVCIAKNEDKYIDEWIDYNIKLGFDNIILYQNNWRYNSNRPNVKKIIADGESMQLKCYNSFVENYWHTTDWAAFIDVDEFIVLKKHKNIKDFLSDYENFNSIGINWVFFGDNGLIEPDEEYSVIKRFTKRQKSINAHVKNIVKMSSRPYMNIHNPNFNWIDTNKNQQSGPFNPNGDDTIAQINHYWTKTISEFKEKISRGRADTKEKRQLSEFDANISFNEVEDLLAYNFMYKN